MVRLLFKKIIFRLVMIFLSVLGIFILFDYNRYNKHIYLFIKENNDLIFVDKYIKVNEYYIYIDENNNTKLIYLKDINKVYELRDVTKRHTYIYK